jgi:hypothetical protein
MSAQQPDPPSGRSSALGDLLARQAQIRAWIEQLDASTDDVPPHVVDRVRGDYETRLAALVEQLREHEAAVRADAERLQDALQLAREEQERAHDELAEGRLRNRLGEWGSDEWATRRAELERIAEDAGAREAELQVELERLDELLFEMGGGGEPAGAPPPPQEPAAREPAVEEAAGEEAVEQAPTGEDFGFLREVDRAMGVEDDVAVAVPAGEEPEPDTRPTPGIKCPDCGYTNDSTAWYCGVCGVSLT